jgi:hypothetical protein
MVLANPTEGMVMLRVGSGFGVNLRLATGALYQRNLFEVLAEKAAPREDEPSHN